MKSLERFEESNWMAARRCRLPDASARRFPVLHRHRVPPCFPCALISEKPT